jgi:hypothetical protein
MKKNIPLVITNIFNHGLLSPQSATTITTNTAIRTCNVVEESDVSWIGKDHMKVENATLQRDWTGAFVQGSRSLLSFGHKFSKYHT